MVLIGDSRYHLTHNKKGVERTMQTFTATELHRLSERVIESLEREAVVTRYGKPKALMLRIPDDGLEDMLDVIDTIPQSIHRQKQ